MGAEAGGVPSGGSHRGHGPPDAYGCVLPPLGIEASSARQRCELLAAKRAGKPVWQRYEADATLPASRDDAKRMFRKGVPLKLRPKAWTQVGAADAARAKAGAGFYTDLLAREASAAEANSEKAALGRELPAHWEEHPLLRGAPGADAARRVTRALVRAAPAGSFAPAGAFDTRAIAAFALLVYGAEQEEAAFWAARAALSALAPPQPLPHELEGLAIELRTFDNLLTAKAPRVEEKMRALGMQSDAFLSEWLLSLFVRCMPAEGVARVWDALLCEGPKVLVRFAIALLRTAEPLLLAAPDAAGFSAALRTACSRCHDRDALKTAAFDGLGSLPRARLDKLREAAAEELTAERADASSRRNSHAGAKAAA